MNKKEIQKRKKNKLCLNCGIQIREEKNSNIGLISHDWDLKSNFANYDKRVFICSKCYNKGVDFNNIEVKGGLKEDEV